MDDLRTYLGREYSGRDDASLEQALASAQAFFENETDRKIEKTTHTLQFVGSGRSWALLQAYPVVSVTEGKVLVGGVSIPKRSGFDSGWYLDGPRLCLSGASFPEGVECSVEYQAGYETVPSDVRLAVVQLAVYFFRERDRMGVFSRSITGQESTSYQVVSLPISIKTVIDGYRMRSAG